MSHLTVFRKPSHRSSRTLRIQLRVEELEARTVLTVFTPAQITHAYGIDTISFGGVKGDGSNQTIAIVDAYDAPKLTTDLAFFSNKFSLPAANLTVAYAQGSKPKYDVGWAQETTLDVEWAHAIAPGAKILLVEAASSSFANLLGAVDYARNQAGVVVVSMSWGSSEFNGETAYDSHFLTPSGHIGGSNLPGGVTFVASSGDTGAVPEYPAVSPNVLAVGGTSIVTLDSAGTYGSETGWSGSGGGVSTMEPKPGYQSSVTQSSKNRTSPDVAYDADPNTGVYVYFQGGWYAFGGTSIGAPQWAALVAITDQGRGISGVGSLDGASQTLPAIYNLPSTDFHDITKGSTKTKGKTLNAGPDYDLVTGRGSPIANLVIQHLVTATATGTVNTNGGGSGGGGSTGTPTMVIGPVATIPPVSLAGLLQAALASADRLSSASFQSAPAVSFASPRLSLNLDNLSQSSVTAPPSRVTAALATAFFGSGVAGTDFDQGSDEWEIGNGWFDATPLDAGAEMCGGQLAVDADE